MWVKLKNAETLKLTTQPFGSSIIQLKSKLDGKRLLTKHVLHRKHN